MKRIPVTLYFDSMHDAEQWAASAGLVMISHDEEDPVRFLNETKRAKAIKLGEAPASSTAENTNPKP